MERRGDGQKQENMWSAVIPCRVAISHAQRLQVKVIDTHWILHHPALSSRWVTSARVGLENWPRGPIYFIANPVCERPFSSIGLSGAPTASTLRGGSEGSMLLHFVQVVEKSITGINSACNYSRTPTGPPQSSMVKAREWSQKTREEVIALHKNGNGYKKIAKLLNIPRDTIGSIIRKFKLKGTVETLPGRGRKKILTATAVRYLKRNVEKNPRVTAKELKKDLSDVGTEVSAQTIRRPLHNEDLHARTPRRTPLLTPKNKKKSTAVCQKSCGQATKVLGQCTVVR
ncbi:hypothetical protein NFI96_007700 [Prochilodus magdalenae]|nr:hypothetical protein NFI96_007700 [Prochilodus magdalenae]